MTTRPPILVLGAARSGTKLVRSMIGADPRIGLVPFDVGFVWRYGNEGTPHDEFPRSFARRSVVDFIHDRLPRIVDGNRNWFVEKTVGNSLRPAFVRAVYPEARIVVVVRDGYDVVESAMRSWRSPPGVSYLMTKLRTLPPVAGLPYAVKYARNTLRRVFGRASTPVWGPVYRGMPDDARTEPLHVVCARQWAASARALREQGADLGAHHVIRYEQLVRNPALVAGQLSEFADLDRDTLIAYLERNLRSDRIGAAAALESSWLSEIETIVAEERGAWGYGRPSVGAP